MKADDASEPETTKIDDKYQYRFHYFDLYGRGEPIRMALWYAKIPFDDNRLAFNEFAEMKAQMPYGQLPALEFPDGSFLAQSDSILKYIGEKYSLRPKDPFQNALADSIAQHTWQDVLQKVGAKIFSQSPERDEELQEAINTYIPGWFKKVAERLPENARFLTGDELTIYDFTVAGILVNLICNADARDSAMWQKVWNDDAPERVKQYYKDFCKEMEGYLTERKVGMTM